MAVCEIKGMRTSLLAVLGGMALLVPVTRADDHHKHHRHHGWNEGGFYYEEPVRVYRYRSDDQWDYYRPQYYYRERRIEGRAPRASVLLVE